MILHPQMTQMTRTFKGLCPHPLVILSDAKDLLFCERCLTDVQHDKRKNPCHPCHLRMKNARAHKFPFAIYKNGIAEYKDTNFFVSL